MDTWYQAEDVAVAGTHAYVADGAGGGLVVVDISDPVAPRSRASAAISSFK